MHFAVFIFNKSMPGQTSNFFTLVVFFFFREPLLLGWLYFYVFPLFPIVYLSFIYIGGFNLLLSITWKLVFFFPQGFTYLFDLCFNYFCFLPWIRIIYRIEEFQGKEFFFCIFFLYWPIICFLHLHVFFFVQNQIQTLS